MYDVVIYAPDRHILYSGHTPDRQGVGGGITARIRLAEAWAALGHRVRIVGHVPRRHSVRGVSYLPLDRVRRLACDIIVLTSSGDRLDLSPVLELDLDCRLRLAWVHGVARVAGIDATACDYVVAVSNFIRSTIQRDWGIPPDKIFVAYNGVQAASRRRPTLRPSMHRDPCRLVYIGHPVKGCEAALGVLRLSRAEDSRFTLHIYGGRRLWGQSEQELPVEEGVHYHGLVGQRVLARELSRGGISLHLQSIEEGFGLGVVEAMSAGCIPIGSPVGALPELIETGRNGYLLAGDHLAEGTWQAAAGVIRDLSLNPGHAEYLRRNARCTPLDWPTLAQAWVSHWDWALGRSHTHYGSEPCPGCYSREHLRLADGYHCTRCGMFRR